MAQEYHWLPGFNFSVEEWDAEGLNYQKRYAKASALRYLDSPVERHQITIKQKPLAT